MARVLIVGSSGQDGTLLSALVSKRGDTVIGVDRVAGARSVDLLDRIATQDLVRDAVPDELYYLAAHHHSSQEAPDFADEIKACFDVHVVALVNVLEALRGHRHDCHVFYAGSSHMFGDPAETPQRETTRFAPRNAYAITKVSGAHACARYRELYGMHVSVGILYNHESPLRSPQFVTARLVGGAREAAKDPSAKLRVGSLSASVDWGWAADYVDAMTRIVAEPRPDDYVIATGEPHTVRDLAEIAYATVGRDYRDHVVEDATIVKSAATRPLVGDASKLRAKTGWKPTVTFVEMVERLVAGA